VHIANSRLVPLLVLALLFAALTPVAGFAAPGGNLVANPSFADGDADGDGVADCWQREPYPASDDGVYGLVAGRTDAAAQRVEATALAAGANHKVVPDRADPACASPVTPGGSYELSLWYRSAAEDLAVELYVRDAASGAWRYSGVSYKPEVTATAEWTEYRAVTDAVPAGVDAISFALALFGDATPSTDWIEVDDVALVEVAAGGGPPATEEVTLAGLNQPTAIEFLPDDRVVIAEKPGVIKVFDSLTSDAPTQIINLEDDVSSFGDFGLTSLAFTAGHLFATYQVDDGWGDTCPNLGNRDSDNPNDLDGCPTTGRLVKYELLGDGALGSEQIVLEGYDKFCFQYITHGVDALEVDPADGSLLMSAGDGANYNVEDNGGFANPCDDGPPNGGAFRSQMGDTYDGRIIRIDPATGAVLAVEARGLRNPFRMSLAGGDLYVTDTGWGAVEELNRLALGGAEENFGWPCFEGKDPQYGYEAAFDNPLCDRITPVAPLHEYAHDPDVYGGRASITAVEELGGLVYFGDVTLEFIKALDPATGEVTTVVAGDSVNPVDLRRTPGGGLVYVDIGVVNVGASQIDPGTGSVEAVVPGTAPGDGGGDGDAPTVEILLQQDPYRVGDVVPFTADVDGFRVSVTYEWSGTVASCDADGCTKRPLTPAELVTDRADGTFVGPDDPAPGTVELTVVVTAQNGATVTDTASLARAEDPVVDPTDPGDPTDPPGDPGDPTDPPVDPSDPSGREVDRIAGADRIATAVEVSRRQHQPGVDVAYVARADDFPDALAAGPLAAANGGPVLLTDPAGLSPLTAAELDRLRPGRVVVLGGPAAVADEVVAALAAAHPAVERLAGPDRYATAVAIADRLGTAGSTVYVATGERFPDALVGGAAAGTTGGSVLLTGADGLAPATGAALTAAPPARIVLLGGHDVVPAAVEAALAGIAPTTRVAGPDRFATAAALSAVVHPGGTDVAYVATGEDFPDALSVAPAVIADGAALLLTARDTLPGPVAAELERLDPARVTIVGGEAAVGPAVDAALRAGGA